MEKDETTERSTVLPENAKAMLKEMKEILKADKDSVGLDDLLGEPLRMTLLNLNRILTEHVLTSGMPPEFMNNDLKAINCITQGGLLLAEGLHDLSPSVRQELLDAVVASMKDMMMHLSANPRFGELMNEYIESSMISTIKEPQA